VGTLYYSSYADTPGTVSVIFKPHVTDWEIFVHELGHTFGLRHPFDEPAFREGSTRNFMDYIRNPNMFWRWQWIDLRDFFTKPQRDEENDTK
jgi:hypothetical protein